VSGNGPSSLGPADQAALDALLGAGFDLGLVPTAQRERAERVGRLLGVLDATPAAGGLVERTLERISRECPSPCTLSLQDRNAVDALEAAGWDAAAVPAEHRARARQVVRVFDELRVGAISGPRAADLADRTIDLVRMAGPVTGLGPAGDLGGDHLGARRGFRLADLVSVAAMVLIGIAVFWPVLGGVRSSAERALCAQNMNNAGVGFGLFGSDRAGRLPMKDDSLLRVSPGLATWWDVGTPGRSHSANLFELVDSGYSSVGELACPGNSLAPILPWMGAEDWREIKEVSYSYRLFGGAHEPRLATLGRGVLLTDKSPVIGRAKRGERVYALERSHNHHGGGQNVLFADGSVEWLESPVMADGDNLWLPKGFDVAHGQRLGGTELPADAADVFVGP